MFAGAWKAGAQIVATISDGSSAPVSTSFCCQSLTQNLDVLVLVKNAKGATLTVTHTQTDSFDVDGNVAFQAAAVHQYDHDHDGNDAVGSSSGGGGGGGNDVAGLLFQGAVITTL